MAKIGLRNFRYGILTENQDGTYHYGGALIPGKAVDCSVSLATNTAKLRADDGDAEVDASVSGGTFTMGVDRADLQTQANILGHTIGRDDNLVRNINDIAPYVGVGRIITELEDGVKRYKTEIFHKIKFSEPNQEDQTKQETTAFGTTKYEGQISFLQNGDWSDSKYWTSFSDALEYLVDFFAAPEPDTTDPVTSET